VLCGTKICALRAFVAEVGTKTKRFSDGVCVDDHPLARRVRRIKIEKHQAESILYRHLQIKQVVIKY